MKKLVKESLFEAEITPSSGPEEIKSTSSKKGFETNIEDDTLQNDKFREVLYTGKNLQLVLMTLKPGENIGMEVHQNDQFFRFETGNGKVIINDTEYNVSDGTGIIVPAGSNHDIINTGKVALQLYTLYGPPHHKDGTIHNTKEDAERDHEEFKGKTTE
jgi:mannose-6-phosphate isomerase-like protein (cupin superfamily)